jgi:AmmeMemoRadiSam system protein B/AmmeMemoRadiSam system protein A
MAQRSMKNIFGIFLLIVFLTATGQCGQRNDRENAETGPIREPVVAGAFYPDDAHLLAQQVDHFLENVPPQTLSGRPVGLVVPHAGYVYSGQVAAYAYRLIQDLDINTVIMVGCSHRASYSGASVYDRGAYRTPLGLVPIDEPLAETLISLADGLRYLPEAHQAEHSLEVELPFLQRILGEFRLVPILLGHQNSYQELKSLAQAIAQAAAGREDILLVASSDMSHYPDYDDACRVDGETLEIIKAFDPKALAEHEVRCLQEGVPGLQCTLCGTEAVMVVMMAARMLGADSVKILKYANSGDIPMGEHDRVVGYGAVVFYDRNDGGSGGAKEERKDEGEEGWQLNEAEQQQLLTIARASIAAGLKGQSYAPPEGSSAHLREHRGAFVTLNKHGRLRGCIGQFQPEAELVQTVAQMTQAAAFRDGRFSPLGADELEQVEIEISVLSPLRKIASIDEIELGTHGIWIVRGGHSGCYLPQVATQRGWSRTEFLEHCCHDKAFLPKDAYLQDGTEIYVFTAQVFHEQ